MRDCAVQYLRPARLDDLLVVEVGLGNPATDVGRASLRFEQRALRFDGAESAEGAGSPATVLATGTVRVACVDRRSGRPVGLPQRVTESISERISMQHSTRVAPDGTAQQQ